MKAVNSLIFLQPLWKCWTFLGVCSEPIKFKKAYLIYSVIINVLVTLCYPLHLALVFQEKTTQADMFRNLAVFVTCFACSTKFIIYALKRKTVYKLENLLKKLDARIITNDEAKGFQQLHSSVRRITSLFLWSYFAVGAIVGLSFLTTSERNLMYPAWFPFDWRHSNRNYFIASGYQFIGISYLILQNYANDTFPPIALCLLSAHIKIFGMRVTKIGNDNDDQLENEREFRRCIADQKNLYRLYAVIQEIISIPMMIQFAITAITFCTAVVAMTFFVDSLLYRIYYSTHFFIIPLQIFPACYYGTYFHLLFQKLQQDIFYSNWMYQNRNFRKNMILFCERSLKTTTAKAGNFLPINLETFISTSKGAYSLLTLFMNFKTE